MKRFSREEELIAASHEVIAVLLAKVSGPADGVAVLMLALGRIAATQPHAEGADFASYLPALEHVFKAGFDGQREAMGLAPLLNPRECPSCASAVRLLRNCICPLCGEKITAVVLSAEGQMYWSCSEGCEP